ncbi:MAG: transcriptional regulator [Mycobacterium sp.]|nr:helix-turn-helix transcriptional regulator [Mycobacterium sp.]MCW2661989.1 transcriptional regulator [Mycobacterium sp.]
MTVINRTALAEFLRARRDLISPADVGLPAGDRRRVAGLRREEVAVLANISAAYYLRLEQGREHNPSHEVLVGIGRALRLNDDAVAYMHSLVHEQPGEDTRSLALDPAINTLIDGWPCTATHVHDRSLTVVASNRLARALSPQYDVGSNTLRALFLDPEMRDFYRNWQKLTAWTVRLVRAFIGHDPNPELLALIDELRAESPRFRNLWVRHEVKNNSSGLILISHPRVGPLDLHFQHLVLPGPGHVMVVFWADPASPSEDGLRRLAGT